MSDERKTTNSALVKPVGSDAINPRDDFVWDKQTTVVQYLGRINGQKTYSISGVPMYDEPKSEGNSIDWDSISE